jgi:hypothetical protein
VTTDIIHLRLIQKLKGYLIHYRQVAVIATAIAMIREFLLTLFFFLIFFEIYIIIVISIRKGEVNGYRENQSTPISPQSTAD